MIFKANRFGKKLYLMIVIIIVTVFGSTYLMNNFFLARYYIYRTKNNIDLIYNKAKTMSLEQFKSQSNEIELNNNVTIIFSNESYDNNIDINSFNENMQLELNKSKVNITKFWITQDDLNIVNSGDYVNKIFYQPKLQSNYFAKIFKDENDIVLIGTSMTNNSATINIVNQFNFYIITISVLLSLFLVWLFTRKTIKSIGDLKKQADDISNLKFSNVEIKTNDEIEELSKSLNIMSESLKKAHDDLEKRNEDLKILISSISHEVKTPLALIKAYTIGINDGLDDGTFGNIIIEQVDNTSNLVSNLLELSRVQRGTVKKENFDLIKVIDEVLEKYKISLKNQGLNLIKKYNNLKVININVDKAQFEIVLNNFISNAIKYNDGDYVKIEVNKVQDNIRFSIKNKTNTLNEEELENLWKPFYVVEKSRSKDLSGTGIGLSIVSSILEANDIKYTVELKESEVEFSLEFS